MHFATKIQLENDLPVYQCVSYKYLTDENKSGWPLVLEGSTPLVSPRARDPQLLEMDGDAHRLSLRLRITMVRYLSADLTSLSDN